MISCWNFGSGFPFRYLAQHFPHTAATVMLRRMLTEFLETETCTRYGGPQAWNILFNYVSRKCDSHPFCGTTVLTCMFYVIPVLWLELMVQLKTHGLPLLPHLLNVDRPSQCNLSFTQRRGNGVAGASTTDVDREVATVHFSMFVNSEMCVRVCVCAHAHMC